MFITSAAVLHPLCRFGDMAEALVGSGSGRLPRGPHGLTREQVERSQRERLMAAAADAVAEKGYAATSVGDVLKRAGVSRTTFYQLYADKLDCFMAAYRMASEVVAAVMADELGSAEVGGAEGPSDPMERLDRLLGSYLRTLSDNPGLARVFLVEVYAAGPRAIRQRRDSLDQFVDLLATTQGGPGGLLGAAPDPRFAAEVFVGAVSSMVTNLVGTGETHRLPELREPLMRLATRLAGR